MYDLQSLRSLFPQFTEEELKEAIEISKCPVNWTEYNKWVAEGFPYEEDDDVLMNLKPENDESQTRSIGKSIDLYSLYCFVFMYMFGYIVKPIKFFLRSQKICCRKKRIQRWS